MFSQALTNAYIASGIIKALAKYADKTRNSRDSWENLKMIFGGGVPLDD